MNIGNLIFDILSNDAYLSARVGSKIFPVQVPEDTDFPAIVYSYPSLTPTNVKTGTSPLDVADVRIFLYFGRYSTGREVADRVRQLLDGLEGTHSDVEVDRVVFADEDTTDFIEGYGFFVIEQAYTARIKRA